MRISDWSSDVCSSDLGRWFALAALGSGLRPSGFGVRRGEAVLRLIRLTHHGPPPPNQWSRSLDQPVVRWFALAALGSCLRPSVFGAGRGEAVLRLIRLTNPGPPTPNPRRSEEHTSELQSLLRISYAVFCLKKHS